MNSEKILIDNKLNFKFKLQHFSINKIFEYSRIWEGYKLYTSFHSIDVLFFTNF